jgi:hypothetical protein
LKGGPATERDGTKADLQLHSTQLCSFILAQVSSNSVHRHDLGVQRMANAPTIFFYLRIFFGYSFEEGQIKKKKYFLKDYLDVVNTWKKLKILPFMGGRIEVWWILAAPS